MSSEMKEVTQVTKLPICILNIISDYVIPEGECEYCCDYALTRLTNNKDHHGAIILYCDEILGHNTKFTFDEFKYSYQGYWTFPWDFAQEMCYSCHDISDIPPFITRAIDWEVVWNELSENYISVDGYIFKYR